MESAVTTDRQCRQTPSHVASRRWLWTVVVAVIAVRAVHLTQPLVGNFATKQAAYAMAARNWALGRAPLWQPTLDCLSADGERAWHLMEWPATAYAAGLLWKFCGGSLDVWGRIVGVGCSVAAVVFAYLFARRRFGEAAARAASLVVGFAPLSIAYGRGFLLEPSLVAFSFAAVYAFDAWLRGGRAAWLIVAAAVVSLAVATKAYMALLVVPLGVLAWQARPSWGRLAAAAVAFVAFSASTAAWYVWVSRVPSTVGPAAEYHPLGRATVHAWPHPLLTSPEFYLQLLRDSATVFLTPLGLLLLVVGLVDRRFRSYLPWLAACCALVLLFPLKFQAANYYYLVLLPPAALAVGLGWQRAVERFAPSRQVTVALVVACLLIAARYAIGPGYRVPDEDRGVTTAAAACRKLTTVEEPVATLHGSTIDLLYYCDRPGWALSVNDSQLTERVEALRRQGVAYLVIADEAAAARNADFTRWRKSQPVAAAGDDWSIVRLAKTASSADDATIPAAVSRSLPAPRTATK